MTAPHDCALPITKEWFLEHKASPDQVVLFLKKWPQGMDVTRESLQTPGLDLKWFIQELVLPDSAQAEIDRANEMSLREYRLAWITAQVELDLAKAVAYVQFVRVMAVASAKYDRSIEAQTEYNQAVAAAYAENYRKMTPIQAEYERSMITVRIDVILHFTGDNR